MRPKVPVLLFAILGLLIGAIRTPAQNNWRADIHNATEANLWGVAFNGTAFVAVGEGGTILYSDYDGAGWHRRAAGTDVWLLGVGHGQGRWIVVGDAGTILVSDDDGATWQSRSAGTGVRLNAVVHGAGRWLAVGEQGTVVASTDRGDTWQARTLPETGFLRALAFGQDRFLLGGAAGALFTTDDGASFTRIKISTTADIEAAALTPNRMFVTGSRGLRGVYSTGWLLSEDATEGTFRGLAARSDADAAAAGDRRALHYTDGAWLECQVRPGFLVTAMTLGRDEAVAVGFRGSIARSSSLYGVTVLPGNSLRVAYGSELRLRAVPSGPAAMLAFQWLHEGVDVPGATGSELVIPSVGPSTTGLHSVRATSAAGAVHFAATRVVVDTAGGHPFIDPGFSFPFGSVPSALRFAADGGLLTLGSDADPNLIPRWRRHLPGGAIDPRFQPDPSVSGDALVPLADGSFYASAVAPVIRGAPRAASVVRLLADGRIDDTFLPDEWAKNARPLHALPDRRVYVRSDAGIRRLLADGTTDASFQPITDPAYAILGVDTRDRLIVTKDLPRPLFPLWEYPKVAHRFLQDGTADAGFEFSLTNAYARVLVGDEIFGTRHSYGRVGASTSFFRFNTSGPSAPYQSPPPTSYPDFISFNHIYLPDGGFWDFRAVRGVWRATAYGPNGEPDPSRRLELPEDATYTPLAVGPDGALYMRRAPAYSTTPSSSGPVVVRLRPTTGAAARLSNLSVLASATEASPLIVGFTTAGFSETRAVIRAVGPGLMRFGVEDTIAAPRLALIADGSFRAHNEGWPTALAPRFAALGAFPLATDSRDSALESFIGDGAHSAVVTPVAGTAGGNALVELYEVATGIPPRRFINVSARAPVSPGQPLIVGFVISGGQPARLLVRGIGPSLAPFGIYGFVINPKLTLFRGATALYENDDWFRLNPDLTSSNAGTGAFPLGGETRDAAMAVTLQPGAYTVHVSGDQSTTGVALVELYELP